jgi:hypothetical protein
LKIKKHEDEIVIVSVEHKKLEEAQKHLRQYLDQIQLIYCERLAEKIRDQFPKIVQENKEVIAITSTVKISQFLEKNIQLETKMSKLQH